MEYLHIMMDHAKKIPCGAQCYTSGLLDGFSVTFLADKKQTYIINGVDDVNKPILEQLRNRVKTLESFAPLWNREDFQSLLK